MLPGSAPATRYSHKIMVIFATYNPSTVRKVGGNSDLSKFVQVTEKICVILTIIPHAPFSLPDCCIVAIAVLPS